MLCARFVATLSVLAACTLCACDASGDDRVEERLDSGRSEAGAHDGGTDAADVEVPDRDVGEAGARAGDASLDAAKPSEPDVPDGAMAEGALLDASAPSTQCDDFDAPFDRASDAAQLVARFVSVEPALEFRGVYDWTIELLTPTGLAVLDADVAASGFMPAHRHGTSPITVLHERGSPRYQLQGVNLFMAGAWEVRVTATSAATEQDRAVFRACVRDRPDAGGDDGSDFDAGSP